MNEIKNDQSDPYRTPKEVSQSKSSLIKWGMIGIGFVVVTTGVLSIMYYKSETSFGAQRSGPPDDIERVLESPTPEVP